MFVGRDAGMTCLPGTVALLTIGDFSALEESARDSEFLTLRDAFSDAVAPYAAYGASSFVTISFLVPAPGAAALLGLGDLVAMRRCRGSPLRLFTACRFGRGTFHAAECTPHQPWLTAAAGVPLAA